MYMGLIVISVLFGVIGWLISSRLKSKFATYSKVPLQTGMSGREVAARMLDFYNIHDVKIVQGEGMLTDHYNPQTKTVSLSPEVYNGRHLASAAVAAHECGHAVQHTEAYAALRMRSALVPVVQISASLQQYLFMFGIVGIASFNSPIILMIAIAAFGVVGRAVRFGQRVRRRAPVRAQAGDRAAGAGRLVVRRVRGVVDSRRQPPRTRADAAQQQHQHNQPVDGRVRF